MSWHNYDSDRHRARLDGYPDPSVAQSAGKDMAIQLARVCNQHNWDRDRIVFLVVDGSSAVIGVHTFIEFGRGSVVVVNKAHHKTTQDLSYTLADKHRSSHKLVYCDDFINTGCSVRRISMILAQPIDLCMVIKCCYSGSLEQQMTEDMTSYPAARLVSVLNHASGEVQDMNHSWRKRYAVHQEG